MDLGNQPLFSSNTVKNPRVALKHCEWNLKKNSGVILNALHFSVTLASTGWAFSFKKSYVLNSGVHTRYFNFLFSAVLPLVFFLSLIVLVTAWQG